MLSGWLQVCRRKQRRARATLTGTNMLVVSSWEWVTAACSSSWFLSLLVFLNAEVSQCCDSGLWVMGCMSPPHGITHLVSDEIAEITDHLGSLTVVSLKNIDRYLQTHPEQSHSVSNTVVWGFVVKLNFIHIPPNKPRKSISLFFFLWTFNSYIPKALANLG